MFCDFKGVPYNPLGTGPGDNHVVHGEAVAEKNPGAPGGVKAFGILAHNDVVERRIPLQKRRHATIFLDGPDPGVKVEFEAQCQLRCDFRAIGKPYIRVARGTEKDGIGLFAGVERGIGQVIAGFGVTPGAHRVLRKGESEIGMRLLERQKYFERFRDHFRADAVSREYGNVVRWHARPFKGCCTSKSAKRGHFDKLASTSSAQAMTTLRQAVSTGSLRQAQCEQRRQ